MWLGRHLILKKICWSCCNLRIAWIFETRWVHTDTLVVWGQVVTFVDGVNELSTTMDYKLSQPMTSHHCSSLFLGHSISVSQPLPHNLHCQLGNIFLFNGYALSIIFYIKLWVVYNMLILPDDFCRYFFVSLTSVFLTCHIQALLFKFDWSRR